MKLNKKTIYRVKTQELFDKMMKDAKEQYRNSLPSDVWNVNREKTAVRIDEDGSLSHSRFGYYYENKDDDFYGYCFTDYKDIPEIYPLNFGGFCVDAPDFKTAYAEFQKHMLNVFGNKSNSVIPLRAADVYTVRVDDKNTTVITPDGKTATAKCHPDDEFDVVEGFRVALEKIKRQDIKLNQKEREILNAIIVLGGTSFYINDEHDLIADFDDESVYVSIEEDDFKWCEEYEDYDVKELLEQCS